jgi:hypothetical protein
MSKTEVIDMKLDTKSNIWIMDTVQIIEIEDVKSPIEEVVVLDNHYPEFDGTFHPESCFI